MTITPDQLIMRAKQYIFHIKCFKCMFCDKNLNTGDEYGIKESAILCRNHFYNDMDTNETTVKFEPFNIQTILGNTVLLNPGRVCSTT